MKARSLFFFCLTVFSLDSSACDCHPSSLGERLYKTDVIFVGRLVEKIDSSNLFTQSKWSDGNTKYDNFLILKSYKGLFNTDNVLSIIAGGTNCDINFKRYNLGDTFLIYAYPLNPEGFNHFLATSLCAGTKHTQEIADKDELDFFRSKEYNGVEWITHEHTKIATVHQASGTENACDNSIVESLLSGIVGSLITSGLFLYYLRRRDRRIQNARHGSQN